MPNDDENPPIRLILAALFMAARIAGKGGFMPLETPEERARLAVADADELLRQVPSP